MKAKQIMKIFRETAYVRMGGTEAEKQAAAYIVDQCAQLGLQAGIEEFDVDMATLERAVLTVDGAQITCKGYLNAGSHTVEAPIYYLRGKDKYSLSQCKGKIVLIDGYMGYWMYQDLRENVALRSFICCSGRSERQQDAFSVHTSHTHYP